MRIAEGIPCGKANTYWPVQQEEGFETDIAIFLETADMRKEHAKYSSALQRPMLNTAKYPAV